MQKNSTTRLPLMSDIDRRTAMMGAASLGTVALLAPQPAAALAVKDAENLIRQVTREVQSIINSGQSQAALIRKFEGVFQKYADVPRIAATLLGPPWRSANSADRTAYVRALTGYLARKYGKRFREFIGGQIIVRDARKVKSFYEVKTTAILKGVAPFDVSFFVSDKSGKDLFFDMRIEGISLVNSEKQEIGAMLEKRGGNLDRLIADLKKLG